MTIVDELDTARSRRGATPFARVTRTLTRQLAVQLAWYFGIMLVLALGTIAVMLAIDEPTVSVVQFGRQSAVWFPFAIAVIVGSTSLPVHIAAGVTRGTFVRGALAAAVILGVVYAVVFAAALALEGALYDAAGWQHRITDNAWFSSDAGDLVAVLVGQLLSVLVAQCSGYLVGVVYQRVGGWWGTLLLPVTAGPVLGVVALLSEWIDDDALDAVVRLPLAVLVAALLAAAFSAVARRFPMSSTGG